MAVIGLFVQSRANRSQLHRKLGVTHEVFGPETLERKNPDVIIADQPGFELWEKTIVQRRQADAPQSLPVLLLTHKNERNKVLQQLGKNVDEFVTVPVSEAELSARLLSLVRIRRLSEAQTEQGKHLAVNNKLLKEQVDHATARLKQSLAETVTALTQVAEYKDTHTGGHVKRVSYLTTQLADMLGCDAEFRENLFYASAMHDIGKVGIPDTVLLKQGRLTEDEWEIMKSHTTIGYNILKGHESPYAQLGAEIALNHHERYDGTGYPNAKSGQEIPFSAYLMSLVDIYDAVRSVRPYKAPMSHEHVCSIILEGDNRTKPEHFHPDVLNAFRRCVADFADIYAAFSVSP